MHPTKEISKLEPQYNLCQMLYGQPASYLYVARTTLIDCYKLEDDAIYQQPSVQIPESSFVFECLTTDGSYAYASVRLSGSSVVYRFSPQKKPQRILETNDRLRQLISDGKKLYYITQSREFFVFKDVAVKMKAVTENSLIARAGADIVLVEDKQMIYLTNMQRANVNLPVLAHEIVTIHDSVYLWGQNNHVYQLSGSTCDLVLPDKIRFNQLLEISRQLFLLIGEKFYLFDRAQKRLTAKCATRHRVLKAFGLGSRVLILSRGSDLQLMNTLDNKTIKNHGLSAADIRSPQIAQDMYLNYDAGTGFLKMTQLKTGFSKRFEPLENAVAGVEENYVYQVSGPMLQLYDISDVTVNIRVQLELVSFLGLKKVDTGDLMVLTQAEKAGQSVYCLQRVSIQNSTIVIVSTGVLDSAVKCAVLGAKWGFIKTRDSLMKMDYTANPLIKVCNLRIQPETMCFAGPLLIMTVGQQVLVFSGAKIVDRFQLNDKFTATCQLKQPGVFGAVTDKGAVQVIRVFEQQVGIEQKLPNFGALLTVAGANKGMSVLSETGLMILEWDEK